MRMYYLMIFALLSVFNSYSLLLFYQCILISKVKEWLQSLGIVDQVAVVQDDDEPDDGAIPLHHEGSSRNRWVHTVLSGFCFIKKALVYHCYSSSNSLVLVQKCSISCCFAYSSSNTRRAANRFGQSQSGNARLFESFPGKHGYSKF